MFVIMHRLYLFLNVYCPSVTLHNVVNYCVTGGLLLNCVRATVSAIRPGSPSVCLFVFIYRFVFFIVLGC